MSPPTLTYFGLPGRAEVARLLFTIGKVEFVDNRVTFEEWRGEGSPKPKAPFGQVPMLEVDGKALAQSPAIDRYIAHLAGLLPSDPWKVALADQAYAFMEDVMQTIYPTFKIQDADEKIKARQEIVKGALADKLTLLSKHIEGRPGKYLTGDTISHGDLAVFCSLSTLQSGWLDGVPSDLLASYPSLKAFRNAIASLPEVAAFYAKQDDDIRVKGFRADA